MGSYEQIPIRVALSTVSSPPETPVDANTGNAPRFWRSQSVAIQVAVFDQNGNPVDLANIESLQFTLMQSSSSPNALVVSTLTADEFEQVVTSEGWLNGTDQNATFELTPADTDQSCGGGTEQSYWGVFQGITVDGNVLTYGAGPIVIYNPGLPVEAPLSVDENEQTNASGNFTVAPGAQVHTEIVTVEGTARTSYGILSQAGAVNGNTIRLLLLLPTVSGIVIYLVSGSLSGPVVKSLTTNGTNRSATADFVYSNTQGQWVLTLFAIPSVSS